MMKKLCTIFLACALLCSAFCLMASAEEPTWVFTVNGVNGKISGEDAYIFTTQEAYEAGNPNWAVTLLLEVQDNGMLKVKEAPIQGPGSVPEGVKLGNGVVALVVHSAGSDISAKDQYANVESKLAARDATAGMYIVLEGIDLDAGTGSGSASLYTTAPEGLPADDPSDEPSSEEPAPEETSSETVETPSEDASVAESSEASSEPATSAPESSTQTSSDVSAASSNSSEASSDGVSTTAIVIIVIAAVVIIAAVVVIVIKRKK